MEKASSSDMFDIVFEGEVTVKHDLEVADVCGGGLSGVVEVLTGLGERIWTSVRPIHSDIFSANYEQNTYLFNMETCVSTIPKYSN